MKKIRMGCLICLLALLLLGCSEDESKEDVPEEQPLPNYEVDVQELISENSRLQLEMERLERHIHYLERQLAE